MAAIPADDSQPPRAGHRRRWLWPLAWFLAGVLAFVGAQLLALSPQTSVTAARVGASMSLLISRASGILPLAIGELLLLGYGTWLAFLVIRAARALRRRRRTWSNVLAGGARRALRDGGIIVVAFYVLWGLNYARPPLHIEAALPLAEQVTTAEWVSLAEQAALAANDAYVALHGVTDAGTPTTLRDARAVEAALDEGWRRAASVLALPPAAHARWGRVKWPLLSPVVARGGIVGLYFPFTAEANVVRGLPAVHATQTMAHEKAHQRGIAREGEASFVGFVAGSLAHDPLSRYGAAVYAHGMFMRPLARRAPHDARRIRALRHPGVQRDIDDAAEYFRRHAGVASAIGGALNDRYLRANRVPGGIANYGASAMLLVLYARRNGGRLLPDWTPAAS